MLYPTLEAMTDVQFTNALRVLLTPEIKPENLVKKMAMFGIKTTAQTVRRYRKTRNINTVAWQFIIGHSNVYELLDAQTQARLNTYPVDTLLCMDSLLVIYDGDTLVDFPTLAKALAHPNFNQQTLYRLIGMERSTLTTVKNRPNRIGSVSLKNVCAWAKAADYFFNTPDSIPSPLTKAKDIDWHDTTNGYQLLGQATTAQALDTLPRFQSLDALKLLLCDTFSPKEWKNYATQVLGVSLSDSLFKRFRASPDELLQCTLGNVALLDAIYQTLSDKNQRAINQYRFENHLSQDTLDALHGIDFSVLKADANRDPDTQPLVKEYFQTLFNKQINDQLLGRLTLDDIYQLTYPIPEDMKGLPIYA